MRERLRLVVVVTLAVVLLAAAAVGGAWWWRERHTSDLERALDLAPTDTERVSWTDWADVRRELDAGLDAASPEEDLDVFLDSGYDADLISASALVESAPLLQEEYGWSPASVEWELFAQSEAGAAAVVGLPDDLDVEALGDRLADLGYTPPDDDTGVWMGGEETVAELAAGRPSTPVLQYVALDADDHVLTASDNAAYLESVLADRGASDEFDQVAEAAGEPLSAALYLGSHVCSALAMTQADPVDQEEADRLIAEAGGVNPISTFAMAVQPDLDVLVAMTFETEDQARANSESRSALASGPAPGQGGSFSDRFTLGDVTADGTLVTFDLQTAEGASVLSDLSTGPVLFATC